MAPFRKRTLASNGGKASNLGSIKAWVTFGAVPEIRFLRLLGCVHLGIKISFIILNGFTFFCSSKSLFLRFGADFGLPRQQQLFLHYISPNYVDLTILILKLVKQTALDVQDVFL